MLDYKDLPFMIGIYHPNEYGVLCLVQHWRVYDFVELFPYSNRYVIPSVPEKGWNRPPRRLYEIPWRRDAHE